jgi:hypothetical protein
MFYFNQNLMISGFVDQFLRFSFVIKVKVYAISSRTLINLHDTSYLIVQFHDKVVSGMLCLGSFLDIRELMYMLLLKCTASIQLMLTPINRLLTLGTCHSLL